MRGAAGRAFLASVLITLSGSSAASAEGAAPIDILTGSAEEDQHALLQARQEHCWRHPHPLLDGQLYDFSSSSFSRPPNAMPNVDPAVVQLSGKLRFFGQVDELNVPDPHGRYVRASAFNFTGIPGLVTDCLCHFLSRRLLMCVDSLQAGWVDKFRVDRLDPATCAPALMTQTYLAGALRISEATVPVIQGGGRAVLRCSP